MADSSALATQNQYPNGVSVLLIGWEGDHPGLYSRECLHEEIDSDLGWNTLAIKENKQTTMDSGQRGQADNVTSWMQREDQAGKLLVIGYFGHGSIAQDAEGREKLYASGFNPTGAGVDHSVWFDLTHLQEYALEELQADVLWCIECCYASYKAPPTTPPKTPKYPHNVEVLSAGLGTLENGWATPFWVHRLINALCSARFPKTVMSLSQEVFLAGARDEGCWRSDCGVRKIVLAPRPGFVPKVPKP